MVPSWESDLRSGSWHRSPPQVSSCSVTHDQGTDERKGVPINEGEHVESNRQQGVEWCWGCRLRGGLRKDCSAWLSFFLVKRLCSLTINAVGTMSFSPSKRVHFVTWQPSGNNEMFV